MTAANWKHTASFMTLFSLQIQINLEISSLCHIFLTSHA